MVNNSINIQIPLTVSLQINEHKKSSQMLMEIHVLVWDRHKNVPGVNLLMGLQFILEYWISNGNTDINIPRKHEQICFTQKNHTLSQN
jgi:hypothetical protein